MSGNFFKVLTYLGGGRGDNEVNRKFGCVFADGPLTQRR